MFCHDNGSTGILTARQSNYESYPYAKTFFFFRLFAHIMHIHIYISVLDGLVKNLKQKETFFDNFIIYMYFITYMYYDFTFLYIFNYGVFLSVVLPLHSIEGGVTLVTQKRMNS